MSNSLIPSFLVSDVSKSLRLLIKNERCEQIARFFERITHLLIFSQKTSDSLRKPMSKFPTLLLPWKAEHPLPPPVAGLLPLVVGFLNPMPCLLYHFLINQISAKGGALDFNICYSGPFFLSRFLPFSQWKRSYFEVLLKFKKNGLTIWDP